MKNLSKIILATALMISTQAFASNNNNNQNIEDQHFIINMLKAAGVPNAEITISLQGNNNNNNNSGQGSVSTTSTSFTNTTKSEVISEEAKQTTSIYLRDLKPKSHKDHDIFESIDTDVVDMLVDLTRSKSKDYSNIFKSIHTNVVDMLVDLTGSKSKDYSIIHWINKMQEDRLYNFSCWTQFKKREFAYKPIDINMVSAEEQLFLAQAVYYKLFFDKTNIEIADFAAYKNETGKSMKELVSGRSAEELISSMSRAQPSNSTQRAIDSFMKSWKEG